MSRFVLHDIPDMDPLDRQRLKLARYIKDGSLLEDTVTGKTYRDGWEPEDATFTRDLAWVPELLDELANEVEGLRARLTEVQRERDEAQADALAKGGQSLSRVLGDIQAERERQLEKGYTAEHDDDEAVSGLLAQVAGLLMLQLHDHEVTSHVADNMADYILTKWTGDRRRQIIIALALGVAEAERLDRQQARIATDSTDPRPA